MAGIRVPATRPSGREGLGNGQSASRIHFGEREGVQGGATQRRCSQATGCVSGGIHSRRERGGSQGGATQRPPAQDDYLVLRPSGPIGYTRYPLPIPVGLRRVSMRRIGKLPLLFVPLALLLGLSLQEKGVNAADSGAKIAARVLS